MKPILLNTIALEPNRWTPGKKAFYKLDTLLRSAFVHGFTAFEVWQYHISRETDDEITKIIDLANERSLTFPVIGIYPKLHLSGDEKQKELDEIEKICRYADKLHSHILKFFVGSKSANFIDNEEYENSVAFLKEMAEITMDHGLRMTGEIHENTLFESVESCQKFLNDVDAGNFKICFQPLNFEKTDQAINLFDQLSEKVIHIHLQGRKNGEMCLLEEADIEYNRLIAHLIDSGFTGYFSIEFVKDGIVTDPVDFNIDKVLNNAEKDREYIKSQLG